MTSELSRNAIEPSGIPGNWDGQDIEPVFSRNTEAGRLPKRLEQTVESSCPGDRVS